MRSEEEIVPKLYSIRPTWMFRGRRFLGVRGFTGKPFHPPLTDFPIVCYSLTALFDLVSYVAGHRGYGTGSTYAPVPTRVAVAHDFFVSGTLVLIVGGIVSLATVTTGFFDWWKGMPRDRKSGPIGRAKHTQVWRTANWHMTVMLTVTAIVIVDIVVRLAQLHDGQSSLTVTILSVLAGALVTFGAGYGGTLVFEDQFNVEPLDRRTVWDETEHDQLPGEHTPR